MTRVLSTPYGSEVTSAYYYENVKGYNYLLAVIQHPYGEGNTAGKLADAENTGEPALTPRRPCRPLA